MASGEACERKSTPVLSDELNAPNRPRYVEGISLLPKQNRELSLHLSFYDSHKLLTSFHSSLNYKNIQSQLLSCLLVSQFHSRVMNLIQADFEIAQRLTQVTGHLRPDGSSAVETGRAKLLQKNPDDV